MSALIRYLVADAVRSQRWVAPALAYLALMGVIGPTGELPGSAAYVAVALFPLGAWFGWVAATAEDPVQETVTATAAGGMVRVRLAKFLTGALAASVTGSLAVVLTALMSRFDGPIVAATAVAVLSNAVGGAALGFAAAPPMLPGRGPAVIVVALVCVIDLIVPGLPPMRSTLQVLSAPTSLALPLALAASATAVAAAAVVAAALAVIARRA